MKRLFIGRLDRNTRTRDIEEVFEIYGKLARCEIKSGGTESAYAFVDFESDRDAEDAMRGEHGRKLNGAPMVVEWAKGKSRRPMDGMMDRGGRGGYGSRDECYRCGRRGHWGRDCTMQGFRQRGRGRSPEYRSRRSRYSRSRSRSHSRGRSRSHSPRRSRSRSPRKVSRSPRRSTSPKRKFRSSRETSSSPKRKHSTSSSPKQRNQSPVEKHRKSSHRSMSPSPRRSRSRRSTSRSMERDVSRSRSRSMS